MPLSDKEQSLKTLGIINYALYLLGMPFIGLIIALIKKSDAQNTFMASHFDWQVKTFLYSFIGMIIGGITAFILIGYLVILAVSIWYLYRCIKGILFIIDNKAIA